MTVLASGNFAADGAQVVLPPWKDHEMIALGKEGLNWLLVLVAILFAYFGVIRPLLRTVVPPKAKADEKSAAEGEAGEGEEGEDGVRVTLSGEEGEEVGETFEELLERARLLTRNDPKTVANLIKDWMGVNEEARK